MNQAHSTATLLANPGWHLYRLDFAHDSTKWLPLSEAQFRAASFLDQRIRGPATEPVSISRAELRSALQGIAQAEADFIFHIGHCGSTLVSRALAATPEVLPLREPLSLRQLSDHLPQLPAEPWREWLQLALAAHSRAFTPGQRCMIKATSSCNALIQPIAGMLPSSRMLLMYVPLENYLAGLLGKQAPAADLHGHAPLRLREWQAITGEALDAGPDTLDEAQLAVLSWLTSMARLLAARQQLQDRCLLLDFDLFLADPENGLEELIEFFWLQASLEPILRAWPEISLGYSKQPDQPYSAFNRNRTLARGRLQCASEIQRSLDWAGELIRQYPALHSTGEFL
jgi:hypothetical protein